MVVLDTGTGADREELMAAVLEQEGLMEHHGVLCQVLEW
jgi:hypothetical protein